MAACGDGAVVDTAQPTSTPSSRSEPPARPGHPTTPQPPTKTKAEDQGEAARHDRGPGDGSLRHPVRLPEVREGQPAHLRPGPILRVRGCEQGVRRRPRAGERRRLVRRLLHSQQESAAAHARRRSGRPVPAAHRRRSGRGEPVEIRRGTAGQGPGLSSSMSTPAGSSTPTRCRRDWMPLLFEQGSTQHQPSRRGARRRRSASAKAWPRFSQHRRPMLRGCGNRERTCSAWTGGWPW